MDIELCAKLITLAGSVFAIYKAISEFVFSKKSRLREEFKFTKQFIADLKPDTHPFIIEKGFLAISGDPTLTAKEIIFLLSLPSPGQALKKYSFSRKYIEIKEETASGKTIIIFSKKYSEKKRKSIKQINSIGYFLFATLALTPFFFAKEIFVNNWWSGLLVTFMAFPSFGFLAYIFLEEYSRVLRSEELVAMQQSSHI